MIQNNPLKTVKAIKVSSLVLYKNQVAIIEGIEGDKYAISFYSPSEEGKKATRTKQKVRGKDIYLLSPSPVTSLESVLSEAKDTSKFFPSIKETHELLLSDGEAESIPFGELCKILDSSLKADSIWAVYKALLETYEFTIDNNALKRDEIAFIPRSYEEIAKIQKKAEEKEQASNLKNDFVKRLKARKVDKTTDGKYISEIEALALGKVEKSPLMRLAGFTDTAEKAHRLLLDLGIWNIWRNPHPVRYGMSIHSPSEILLPPSSEDRIEVPALSYAIDSPWSGDPDDAVSYDGKYLWVHIADPASAVLPDSKIDISARARGATMYIPEGASRMLSERAIEDYALGLNKISYALSFRILLNEKGGIEDCDVLKTIVHVVCITYEEADKRKDSDELKMLFKIARNNKERRKNAGALSIDMPEVHIALEEETKKVSIKPVEKYESMSMVQEMMLLAGEGAAKFAFQRNIAFTYIGQEPPIVPNDLPGGLAGKFRLLRCMHRRSVGVTPCSHAGLGLSYYSQVTSPLRRYGDLLAHEQLRAFISGNRTLDSDTMLYRLSAGDEAARASKIAEKKSNLHWTLVYLLQNPDWVGDAVCVDMKDNSRLFIIPSLAQETVLVDCNDVKLNDVIKISFTKIDIPTLSVFYKRI